MQNGFIFSVQTEVSKDNMTEQDVNSQTEHLTTSLWKNQSQNQKFCTDREQSDRNR